MMLSETDDGGRSGATQCKKGSARQRRAVQGRARQCKARQCKEVQG